VSSQEPTACPNSEPDESNLRPRPFSLRPILMLYCHLHLGLPTKRWFDENNEDEMDGSCSTHRRN
jgi:hypothetical protein